MTTGEEKKRHAKPMLTTEDQIDRLKAKGVKFDACKEAEAKTYLEQKCYPFKVLSYRKLFDKHVGGEKDGQYVDLDFEQLRIIATLDQELRELLLGMSLDIEHFEKTALLDKMASLEEDGYSIIADYLDSLDERSRAYIDRELESRSRDDYSRQMIGKYRDDLPAWVLLSSVSFGSFIAFVRYCSQRWGDKQLGRHHYLMKKAKSVRNCSAHGSCILNEFGPSENAAKASPVVMAKLAAGGISKTERKRKLSIPRMEQIATTVYLYAEVVPAGNTRTERISQMSDLFANAESAAAVMQDGNQAISAIRFIERLTKACDLVE